MRRTLVKAGIALVAGTVGLAMVLIGVERNELLLAQAERLGEEARISIGVVLLIILGVLLLNLAVVTALVTWSRYLRHHPDMRQAPVWVLVAFIVVVGGVGLTWAATHSERARPLGGIPLSVDWMFVLGQTILGIVAMTALIVLGVRWIPMHQPARARREEVLVDIH